jgi:hypothetical protein
MKKLSNAAMSVFVFGIYMISLGFIFLFVPEFIFLILAYPTPPDIASRILGMIFFFLAYYYIRAGLQDEGMTNYFTWTVHTRGLVIVFLIVFTMMNLVSPMVILFGAVDLAGAIWTWWALGKDKAG